MASPQLKSLDAKDGVRYVLHKNIIEKSGFRELNFDELDAVSGGHYNEDPTPSVFEDQFPSIGDSIPGLGTWSASADGGSFGDGPDGNWILVTASAPDDGNGNHSGSKATTVPDDGNDFCSWAGNVSGAIVGSLGGAAASFLFSPVGGVITGAILGSTMSFAVTEACNQRS